MTAWSLEPIDIIRNKISLGFFFRSASDWARDQIRIRDTYKTCWFAFWTKSRIVSCEKTILNFVFYVQTSLQSRQISPPKGQLSSTFWRSWWRSSCDASLGQNQTEGSGLMLGSFLCGRLVESRNELVNSLDVSRNWSGVSRADGDDDALQFNYIFRLWDIYQQLWKKFILSEQWREQNSHRLPNVSVLAASVQIHFLGL